MKKLHYHQENYPVTFEWTKPNNYEEGSLIRNDWSFSICNEFGNELEGFCSENELLNYIEQLDDEDFENIQVFAYPQRDGEEIEKYDLDSGLRIIIKYNYVFPNF